MAVAGKPSFYRVLSAAIADLTEHGFDSQERLDRWMQELARTARAALVPESVLQRELRSVLERVYQRAVENGGLIRHHPGVSRLTLSSLKPKLHAELDKRILASANLITLNREASIQSTLQRFVGWATSIPVGGSDVVDRKEEAAHVRRGIAGLPFEERRVTHDQAAKLAASIDDIVARDGGALFGEWQHTREGGGYQARPEHLKRHGDIFVVRNNWALRDGLMKLDGHQYTDQIEAPAELIGCRCRYRYGFNLRDLPPGMLTVKGRSELAQARTTLTHLGLFPSS